MRHAFRRAGAIAALVGGAAFAQGNTGTGNPPTTAEPTGTGGAGSYEESTVTREEAPPTERPTSVWAAHPYTIKAQGGLEGYSGNLASRIKPGATYGVALGIEPSGFAGVELGYSGASSELKNVNANPSGPDILRNGGYAIMTPGVPIHLNPARSAGVRPYLLGGIGVDRYVAQGNSKAFGFSDQTQANVPFGVGLELRSGSFLADARFNYDYQFGTTFAAGDSNPLRYQGQLSLGAAF